MSYEEKVYTKLKQHYHCAQAIFATYASDYGMDQETAYRTMACFAAGMYRGSVCGCVTAALAVLGLAYGFSDTKDREREIFGTKIAEDPSEVKPLMRIMRPQEASANSSFTTSFSRGRGK